MSQNLTEEEIRQMARKRVEEKKGFYSHLTVYIVVNAVLILIWATTGAGYPWFMWVLGGWGIGLLFNYLAVFGFLRQSSDWERREEEKEANKIRSSIKPQ